MTIIKVIASALTRKKGSNTCNVGIAGIFIRILLRMFYQPFLGNLYAVSQLESGA